MWEIQSVVLNQLISAYVIACFTLENNLKALLNNHKHQYAAIDDFHTCSKQKTDK